MWKYFRKMRGGQQRPRGVGVFEIVWSWLTSLVGISAVAWMHYDLVAETDLVMLIGSFGASAVLIYGAVTSPLAQPRNLVGGHLISAVIGVAAYQCVPGPVWLVAGVAVATAIAAMLATRTVHPPGGATALIAVMGSTKIHALGYLYVLMPIGLGVAVMLAVALVMNNMVPSRKYPLFWY